MASATLAATGGVGLLAPLPAGAVTIASSPRAMCETDGRVNDIAYDQVAGVWYLAGTFTRVRGAGSSSWVPRRSFASCSSSTGAVRSWNPGADDIGRAVAVSPDGARVYIGGNFSRAGGANRKYVAAVGSVAGRAVAWRAGLGGGGGVATITVSADGSRVVLGGTFTSAGGLARSGVALLAANDGAVRRAFAPRLTTSGFVSVNALAFAADGASVYVGGRFSAVDGQARSSAARLRVSDGALLAWRPDLRGGARQVDEIRVRASGVYLCGDWHTVGIGGGTRTQGNIARVSATTGAVDAAAHWNTDGGTPACTVVGNLFVFGGHFDNVRIGSAARVRRQHIAAIDVETGRLTAWNPSANSVGGVWAVEAGGQRVRGATPTRLSFGGDFDRTGGSTRQHFATYTIEP